MVQFKSRVKVAELLDVLRTNMARHESIYKEAKDGYINKVKKDLGVLLENVRDSDGTQDFYFSVKCPENHIQDYKSAIRMLELTTDEFIELNYEDFQHLVMDKWNWQKTFLVSNVTYSNMASGCLGDLYGFSS